MKVIQKNLVHNNNIALTMDNEGGAQAPFF